MTSSGSAAVYSESVARLHQTGRPRHRVIVEPQALNWPDALRMRLNNLCNLPIGWDGYDGQPVNFWTASFAASLLSRLLVEDAPSPSIVPIASGGLQLEWHMAGFDIELEIEEPNSVRAWRCDHVTDLEEEVALTNDFSGVAEWMAILTQRARRNAVSAAA